ncbi:MAG: NAD(P)/FAD-dependent oxidoreductase [Deltaproteobacteria bacterium]|nr:NAD(P)/FAD-dependent oxidoreductase [Deltaproteobacteria bacterium]
MSNDYDALVLGAGNAGLAAAGAAHAAGQRVMVVEGRDVGGVCPLRGCVPKKVLVAAAQALDVIARAEIHQISVGPAKLDWPGLIERERTFVDGVPEEFEKSLANRGIELVRGRAQFTGPNQIAVSGRRYSGSKIVVATGSTPRSLPIPGAEHLITSDDLLELSSLPESITFVGAGVIAFEFSHVLTRAGARVTLLEVAPRVLPTLDTDAIDWITKVTRDLGVKIETSVSIDRIEKCREGHGIHYRIDGRKTVTSSQLVVNGAGRVADLAGLDLSAAGIALDRGRIELDEYLRSVDNPDVFFAGDAIPGRPQLSPLATYEGNIVGHNLSHAELRAVEYGFQPAAVYTVPALAMVGLSEEAATEAGLDFEVRTNDMREWRSARTYGETAAWAKVILERETGRILGAHLVGHGAEETIHTFALAIEKGIPASEIASRVYAYPTFHADLKFLV